MEIRITADGDRAAQAFARAPDAMLRALGEGTAQGAQHVARAAKRKVSKVHSTLANSINVSELDNLPPRTAGHEAAAGVAYAPYVEHGTGPAAGRPRYYPNPDKLLDYLSNTRSSRNFAWARGAAGRESQRLDLWFRSRAWAWSIYMKGTRPAPFMAPAAEESDARVRQIVRLATERGIREAFSAGR